MASTGLGDFPLLNERVEPKTLHDPVAFGSLSTASADMLNDYFFGGASGYTLTADQGGYALTGQAAGLLRGFRIACAQGSYALSGQDIAFIQALRLEASSGSYVVTGLSAGLIGPGGSGASGRGTHGINLKISLSL